MLRSQTPRVDHLQVGKKDLEEVVEIMGDAPAMRARLSIFWA